MLYDVAMQVACVIGGVAGGVAGAVDAVVSVSRSLIGMALLHVMGGSL